MIVADYIYIYIYIHIATYIQTDILSYIYVYIYIIYIDIYHISCKSCTSPGPFPENIDFWPKIHSCSHQRMTSTCGSAPGCTRSDVLDAAPGVAEAKFRSLGGGA